MALGGNYDSDQSRIDRFLVEGEAGRAAKAARAAAGYKSRFQRLRERLWPRRREPGNGPETLRTTDNDPGS